MKQQVNHEATYALIEQISVVEQKLQMMKTHINSNTGTVNDMNTVARLFHSIDDCNAIIRNLLVKFL